MMCKLNVGLISISQLFWSECLTNLPWSFGLKISEVASVFIMVCQSYFVMFLCVEFFSTCL